MSREFGRLWGFGRPRELGRPRGFGRLRGFERPREFRRPRGFRRPRELVVEVRANVKHLLQYMSTVFNTGNQCCY